MIDFLTTYHLLGLTIGICTFLIIGMFHPIVIKGEYHFGTRIRWGFLIVGFIALAASLMVENVFFSTLLGVTSFSSFWGILEVFEQEKRVKKGWFPRNPKRTYPWDSDANDDK